MLHLREILRNCDISRVRKRPITVCYQTLDKRALLLRSSKLTAVCEVWLLFTAVRAVAGSPLPRPPLPPTGPPWSLRDHGPHPPSAPWIPPPPAVIARPGCCLASAEQRLSLPLRPVLAALSYEDVCDRSRKSSPYGKAISEQSFRNLLQDRRGRPSVAIHRNGAPGILDGRALPGRSPRVAFDPLPCPRPDRTPRLQRTAAKVCGEVTVKTMAAAIERLPRFVV